MTPPRSVTRPQTVDEPTRSVLATISTGADVVRVGSYPDGAGYGRWIERLDLERAVLPPPGAAPILIDHEPASEAVIGIVEGISRHPGRLDATLRFGSAPRAARYYEDIVSGIRSALSIGYSSASATRVGGSKDEPVFLVVPDIREVSTVPIGSDRAATIRSDSPSTPTRFRTMTVTTPAGGEPVTTPDAILAARTAERSRITAIQQAGALHRIAPATIQAMVDSDAELVDAQRAFIGEAVRRESATQVTTVHAGSGGQDHSDPARVIEDAATAFAHRINPAVKLTGRATELRRMRAAAVLGEVMRANGMKVPSSERALVRAFGAHTTSDFPNLLGATVSKALLPAFQAAKSGLAEIVYRDSTRDFKAASRLRAGEYPALLKVNEHGSYTYGSLSESSESFRLQKFGRLFAVTWEALVNDDLDAIGTATRNAARAAATLEADLLATAVTSNPVMADKIAVFHSTHGNLAGTAAVLSVASISALAAQMRKQVGLDSAIINIAPKYLVVPAALEALALAVVSDITPAAIADSNAAVRQLEVVVEPRLDASSAISWYLFAAPSVAPSLTLAHLDGEESPLVESRNSFEVDAVEVKVRHVAAAYWADFRGASRNAGA